MSEFVVIHRDFTVASVDPRIYGVHLGSPGGADFSVLADEKHPAAEGGIRSDILDLARAFRLPCMLGSPRAGRSVDRNAGEIRLSALIDLCRRADAEPMMSLPLRAAASNINRVPERGVRMWRLGVAGEAVETVADAAIRLSAADPSATLVLGADGEDAADGSVLPWDRHCRSVDLVSLMPSADAPTRGGSTALATAIEEMSRRIDRERLIGRCGRPVGLQVDFWGQPAPGQTDARAALDRALGMNLLIRSADRVRTAFAGNVLVGLAGMLEGSIGMGHRTDGFDPVLAGSVYGRGVSLMPAVRSVESDDGPMTDVAAVRGEDGRTLTLFVANRREGETSLVVDMHGFAGYAVRETRLADPAPRLPGQRRPGPAVDGNRLCWALPPLSYGLVRLAAPST